MATEVQAAKYHGLEPRRLVAAYRNVYLSRKVDDKEIQLKRQNKIYFQISSAALSGRGLLFSWLIMISLRKQDACHP